MELHQKLNMQHWIEKAKVMNDNQKMKVQTAHELYENKRLTLEEKLKEKIVLRHQWKKWIDE